MQLVQPENDMLGRKFNSKLDGNGDAEHHFSSQRPRSESQAITVLQKRNKTRGGESRHLPCTATTVLYSCLCTQALARASESLDPEPRGLCYDMMQCMKLVKQLAGSTKLGMVSSSVAVLAGANVRDHRVSEAHSQGKAVQEAAVRNSFPPLHWRSGMQLSGTYARSGCRPLQTSGCRRAWRGHISQPRLLPWWLPKSRTRCPPQCLHNA